uniref:hypothetical protein n=1 Tax=Endozoicomonas sp. SESOKO3 TaxID=2828744 RepID=UPI0021482153
LKKYGALADQYVRPDIWNAIRHHGRSPLGTGSVANTYRGIINRWKLYKTVYNPVTHFNNTWSNTEMYSMAGHSPKYLGKSAALIFGRNPEADPVFREALDAGLFGSDWSASITKGDGGASNVLEDLAEKLRNQPDVEEGTVIESLDTLMRIKEWWISSKNAVKEADTKLNTGIAVAKAIAEPPSRLIKKPIKAAAQTAQTLYRKEDELFKMAVYMSERQSGKTPREAVQSANHFFFDYNDLPTAIKVIRDFPIGSPFISYSYLAIPAIVKNAVERPERLIALAAAYEAVNYSGLLVNGEMEPGGYWDRVEAETTVSPKWERGRALWGGLNTFHVPGLEGYRLSMANAHALGNPFAGEAGDRKLALPDHMGTIASFWGSDALGSNPFRSLIDAVVLNEDWKGKEIYNKHAPVSEKISKSVNYLYQAWAPSNPLTPGSYHQQKIIEGLANDVAEDRQAGDQPNVLAEGVVNAANGLSEALGGQQFTGLDGMKNPILTWDSVLASLGFKLRPFRPEDSFKFKATELADKIEEHQKAINQQGWLKTKKRITQDQFEKKRDYYRKEIKKVQEELKELRKAKREVVR